MRTRGRVDVEAELKYVLGRIDAYDDMRVQVKEDLKFWTDRRDEKIAELAQIEMKKAKRRKR